MRSYDFVTVDVFTDQRFGGNPLAVFPAAAGLTEAEMQRIAREFNLSETSFVLPPENPAHTAQVRIFTPVRELPFAGHPNVGTGFVLARRQPSLGAVLLFEEKAGRVTIEIERDAGGQAVGARITAPQPLTRGESLPAALIANAVGLAPDDVATDRHLPVVAGVGTEFVFAELRSRAALIRAQPDVALFRAASAQYPRIGLRFQTHLYARDPGDPRRVYTRMFAPLSGILEDPATGSANATLAALLLEPSVDAAEFEIEQGNEMGRPSRMRATARRQPDGSVTATIAGRCVPVMRGQLEL